MLNLEKSAAAFAEAKKLMDEGQAQRGWEASVERELNSLGVND